MATYRVYYISTTNFMDVEARNAEDAAAKAEDTLGRNNKRRSAAKVVRARKLVPPARRTGARW